MPDTYQVYFKKASLKSPVCVSDNTTSGMITSWLQNHSDHQLDAYAVIGFIPLPVFNTITWNLENSVIYTAMVTGDFTRIVPFEDVATHNCPHQLAGRLTQVTGLVQATDIPTLVSARFLESRVPDLPILPHTTNMLTTVTATYRVRLPGGALNRIETIAGQKHVLPDENDFIEKRARVNSSGDNSTILQGHNTMDHQVLVDDNFLEEPDDLWGYEEMPSEPTFFTM
ncbi:hypothetical protein BX666DRAFT_2029550 [Dichotomocladium elegans]|nr:hypothetical protein BX666DRAFT_2029550 [Dichotomocladium elegans]